MTDTPSDLEQGKLDADSDTLPGDARVWKIDIFDPDGKHMQLKVDEVAANTSEGGPVKYVTDTIASMIETLHAA